MGRMPSPKPHEDEYVYEEYSSEDDEETEEEDESDESSLTPPPVPDIVAGRWRVKKDMIGSGSYSEVFSCVDVKTSEKAAVKVEWTKAEKGDKLLGEAEFYKRLGTCDIAPKISWSGTQDDYNMMVLDLLGPSLDDLFKKAKQFSLKTVCLVAEQIVRVLETVHSRGILHRDIKPHNFLMGIGKNAGRVYIVDFGLAKMYLDKQTGAHVAFAKKKRNGVTGTVRYSSITAHQGYDASRRDDLEAVGYMLMHFLRGDLPWLGLKAKSKSTKHKLIGQKKMEVTDEELCKGFPREMMEYFRMIRGMEFAEKPDYDGLCKLLGSVIDRKGFKRDDRFDWSAETGDASESNRRSSQSKVNKSAKEEKEKGRDKKRDKSEARKRSRSRGRKACSRSRSNSKDENIRRRTTRSVSRARRRRYS